MRQVLLFGLLFGALAQGQIAVNQGRPGTQGAWSVTSTGTVAITSTDAGVTIPVNFTAQSGQVTETLVIISDGGASSCTTLNALAGRRSLGIQNCGPNDVTCNIGSACPRQGGGIMINAKANGICGFFAMDLGSNTAVTCLTANANQVADGGTIVIELGP